MTQDYVLTILMKDGSKSIHEGDYGELRRFADRTMGEHDSAVARMSIRTGTGIEVFSMDRPHSPNYRGGYLASRRC